MMPLHPPAMPEPPTENPNGNRTRKKATRAWQHFDGLTFEQSVIYNYLIFNKKCDEATAFNRALSADTTTPDFRDWLRRLQGK